MSHQCATSLIESSTLQRLQSENAELQGFFDAQKQVIASLERRAGRSLDTLSVHVQQLSDTLHTDADWQNSLVSVQSEVDALCDLINDAMMLQKLEAGKVELHLQSLETDTLLTSLSRHLLRSKQTVSSRLVCEFDSSLPLILADQDLTEAVLTDLLARGLRYSDPDSPVVLGASSVGEQVNIFVTAQRFAPLGDRDFATEIVLCCRRIEVQQGKVTCEHRSDGLQVVKIALRIYGNVISS
ncbi:HAMP domain-containing histidine kinase [Phormidium sp. CLA17]|uniref:HAMP domain-containing histidine kinase n=1 Tax=Leptolyngbya sp. Cla-17 TaxID=2803751 RepID=UPI0014930F52|nr:HAMP domain-containing histidine kinase [Leptolyngbya sp. Cla-17]MBM0741274.1 HAMP domain-containing histidine kinase [Leptolyngbya sp. Cla-17]